MNLFNHQVKALEETNEFNKVAIKGYEGLYEIDEYGNVFEKMKDASAYLGRYSGYVSEQFRRTGSNEFIVDGKVVTINE